MEPRARYLLVGTFVIVLVTLLVMAIIWFTTSQHTEHNPFLVYMNEPASGLAEQGPVKFMGVDVGFIDKIKIDPKNRQRVRLLLQIDEGTPIDQSTTATMMAQGITGLTYIGLKANAKAAPPLKIPPGEIYPVIPWTPSLLVQLSSTVREISTSIKIVGKRLDELLGPTNQKSISDSLRHLDELLGPTNQKSIRESLKHIDTISENLAKNSATINNAIKSLDTTLQSGQSVLDRFKLQTLPQMSTILRDTTGALKSVQELTNVLKTNPSVLIRGRAPAPLGPGE